MQDFRTCFSGLRRTFRPIRWKVLAEAAIGVILVVMSLLFVWISKRVVDAATGAVDFPLDRAVALMALIMFLQVTFRIVQNYWEGYVTIQAQNSIRAKVFEKVLRSTWSGKERFHSGDTVNRLEGDISIVVAFLCSTLPSCLVTILQFIASCIFLFNLSPSLAWILVFIMPVAVVGSRLFFNRLRKLTNEIRTLDSSIQGHMQETLQHRITMRTLGCTDWVLGKLASLQGKVYDKTVTRLNYGAVSRIFLSSGFAIGYAVAFFWGAYGLKNGTVTYGLMVAFLQLVGQVQRPIADIARHIPVFIRAVSSEDRLLELENLPQENEESDILFEGVPGVRIENVSYAYPGTEEPVIKNLTFDFKPGTMTAVLGPTGAGKSSLLRIILALLPPEEGKVFIYDGGREVESCVDTRINFMYVPQGNTLISGTIRQNLLLAKAGATDEEIRSALHLAAADFVYTLPDGLEHSCAEIGGGLSEGQAQRIAIARAFLHDGSILILDEATSALDAETELELLQRMSNHFRGKKTIICVTHRPAATTYADSVLKIQ